MSAVRDGDRAAFDAVFSTLWPACRDFARRLVSDAHAAEDVAQGALSTLFARAPYFDSSRSVVSWAFTLTAWEARTWNRRVGRRREAGAVQVEDAARAAETPESLFADAERLRLALAAAQLLDERDRAAVARALLGEGGDGDAAARKRKQRALERLRGALTSLLQPRLHKAAHPASEDRP